MKSLDTDVYVAGGGHLPQYKTENSAGMDLHANLDQSFKRTGIRVDPLQRVLIPTGLFIALPVGFEAQVRPRSGMAYEHGLTVLNTPGTIDADYRGEIKVLVINLSNEPFVIKDGERIAQLVVARHERVEWHKKDSVDELGKTARGAGGFGSTGKGLKDGTVLTKKQAEELIKQFPKTIDEAWPVTEGVSDAQTELSEEDIAKAVADIQAGKIPSVHGYGVAPKPADINGDGKVDEADLSAVHKEYHAEKKAASADAEQTAPAQKKTVRKKKTDGQKD